MPEFQRKTYITKKTFIIIAIIIVGLAMIWFSTQFLKDSMTISQAQLTNQESQIVSLMNGNVGSMLFDFTAEREAKTVSVACYKLDENGKWKLHSGWQNFPLTQASGRIAVSFSDLGTGLRAAVQTGDSTYASESSSPTSDALANSSERMGSGTSYAVTDDIEYEKRIPLAMQVFTTKDAINTCDITFFNEPEEFVKREYSEVYVVVAKFSKKEII